MNSKHKKNVLQCSVDHGMVYYIEPPLKPFPGYVIVSSQHMLDEHVNHIRKLGLWAYFAMKIDHFLQEQWHICLFWDIIA